MNNIYFERIIFKWDYQGIIKYLCRESLVIIFFSRLHLFDIAR